MDQNTTLERRYSTAEFRFAVSQKSPDKADQRDSTTAGGYIAVYNSPSFDLGGFKEVLAPGAFKRSIEAIAAGSLNGLLLWQHDDTQILASTRGNDLKLSEDDTGLAFEFDLGRCTPQQAAAIRAGDVQCSFGFFVRDDAWEKLPDGTIQRTVTDLDLIETTICTFPAYGATSVAMRSLDAWKAQQDDGAHAGIQANEEKPKENVALNIKRALMLKAIEQHIRSLPAA